MNIDFEQTAEIMRRINATPADRRRALKWALAGSGVTAALAVIGRACRDPKERTLAEMNGLVQQGLNMRTPRDAEALGTRASIDIPYSKLATVNRIRQIDDPVKRVMAGIGFLDVENNIRYRNLPNGACNVYALDLLRLALGSDDVGSRYNERTGSPEVLGVGDPGWENREDFDAKNPFLAAWNLDWWMRRYGRAYGWKMMDSQTELQRLLQSGDYIALGVTKKESIPEGRVAGHSYVLTHGGSRSTIGWTQATNHVRFNTIPLSDEKTKPGQTYNIHVHELPNF